MDEMQKEKKKYLKWRFNRIQGEDIALEEHELIIWFELRGLSHEEAKQEASRELRSKYIPKLLNDDEITKTIVEYKDVWLELSEAFENEPTGKELFDRYIDYLSNTFSIICDFSVVDKKLIDPNNVVGQIMEVFIANEIVHGLDKSSQIATECFGTKHSSQPDSANLQSKKEMDKLETKIEKLERDITSYGFWSLSKTKDLSETSRAKLVEFIATKGIPYAIAMFDYLGFIKYLETNLFDVKYKLYIEVSKWFGSDKDGRAIRGNINSLAGGDRKKGRYTAYQHTEKVAKDYEELK